MNTAVQKIILTALHDALIPFYEKHHFKFKKKEQIFFNDSGEIFWGVVAKYPDSVHFQPSLTVLNSAITQILNEIFPGQHHIVTRRLPGKTLAEEFGNFDYAHTANNPDKIDMGIFYKVQEASDVTGVVADHAQFMQQVGFPFLKKLNTIEGIHGYINGRILQYSEDDIRSKERRQELKKHYTKREALSGLVACYLLATPEAEQIAEKYLQLFEGNAYVTDDIQKLMARFSKS